MNFTWPFLVFAVYAISVEIFIGIRINKLQHAIRATILANTKSFEQADQIFANYSGTGFKELLKPFADQTPKYLLSALNQRRRTSGLRLVLHTLGIVVVFVWVAII